jgi:predicted nucleic acid-binding protein
VDRLFIDANVLFSAAYRPGAGVARLWQLDDVELLSSDYAIEEARRNLLEPEQRVRLTELVAVLELVSGVTLDEAFFEMLDLRRKDWPILGGAMAGRATHLITGDHQDFGPFFGHEVGGVIVLPPGAYLGQRNPQ